ncbi:hypothetical protein LY90DRAFT_671091 [Neocallimastix californiae]|uniref:Uncharacterized protein n=1 Tax=Neocallimastix californiae TaxID=1754190 RepID=A0A1Y2CLN4_9FUNG|nr:hypothetical protein LY90DRAFT_671091 [Neocallimastix californiae]|eukprot:ORY47938.1 hypothetical protein LY90DRAFT_671091 [Neocallimastix californiae]
MISSAIDTITPIKNKKKLSNDNISSFKDTLNSLRAKKINNNLAVSKFQEKVIIYFHPNINHPLRNFIGSLPFFLLINNKKLNHFNNHVSKDNSIIIGTNSQYNNSTNYYVNINLQFEPVEYNFARYILSLYSLCGKEFEETIPFYCYCKKKSNNDKDFENLFLGIHYEKNSTSEKTGNFYITEITNNGTFQYDKDLEANDENGLLQITNILNSSFNQEDIVNNKVKGHIMATYNILKKINISNDKNHKNSSTIKLKATWENIQNLLSKPNSSADISLFINCYHGEIDQENHTLTKNLLNELHKLEEWNKIRKGKKWISNQSLNISLKVDSFLNGIKDESYTSLSTDEMDDKLKNLNIISALEPRKDYDFTDKLWKFLINASSNDDLSDAFTAVLEELETFRLQPMVNKTNLTSYANIIRSCLKLAHTQTSPDYDEQKEAISETFDLWQKQPMECLVEIGIWKLKRDYCHYLIGNELTSMSELESFINPTLGLDEQIYNLKILHRITELLVLISNQIHFIPHEINRKLVQKVIEKLKNYHHKLPDNLKFVINFPSINSSTIKIVNSLTKSFKPSAWTIKLQNCDYNNTLTNTYKKKNPIIIHQLCKEENENNLFMKNNNNKVINKEENDNTLTEKFYLNSCYHIIHAKQEPFM